MPIFCPGYAQIGTPFGRKENTMERRFWTQQSSVNNTIQAAGKNICKRVWKIHPPRNANQKSGFLGANRFSANPKHTAVSRGVRTAQRTWVRTVFSLKAEQKMDYFYEVRTFGLYNPHGFWV